MIEIIQAQSQEALNFLEQFNGNIRSVIEEIQALKQIKDNRLPDFFIEIPDPFFCSPYVNGWLRSPCRNFWLTSSARNAWIKGYWGPVKTTSIFVVQAALALNDQEQQYIRMRNQLR